MAYEYLITVGAEIDVVWRPKWSSTTVIYPFNRYLLIASTCLFNLPGWSLKVRTSHVVVAHRYSLNRNDLEVQCPTIPENNSLVDLALMMAYSCAVILRAGNVIYICQLVLFAGASPLKYEIRQPSIDTSQPLAFSALRVYVISDRRIALAILVLLLDLFPAASNAVSYPSSGFSSSDCRIDIFVIHSTRTPE